MKIWSIFTRRLNGSADADVWLSQLSDETSDQDFEPPAGEAWLEQYGEDLPHGSGQGRHHPKRRRVDRESAADSTVDAAQPARGPRWLEVHHDDYPPPRLDCSPEQEPELAPSHAADPLRASFEITERSVIGDNLHRPVIWCQMGSCIASFSDPRALGEADNRARAFKAGWREDKLGRMVCQTCLQRSPEFRAAYPVALPRGSWM